jgi:acyl-CoA synthetase (AMP-forming)/AMP-acid ligase II
MSLGAMQDWPLRVMRLVDHAERQHGDGEIVSAWANGSVTRTTWREVARDARRMAQALQRLGIKPGDRVATLAMNHAHHLTAWYGAIGMGGILHTLNPRLFADQLDYIANHAEDRVLLYDRAFTPIVETMKPRWKTIEHYICFDPEEGEDGFPQWIAGEDGDYQWVEGDEREPCGLCYTSGTTGHPKGVLYEHRSTVLHTLAEDSPDIFNLSRGAVVLPIVPMFHANAWGVPWAAPMVGCKLVLSADYRPDRMCQLFRDERVTHSAGVPTVWLTMIEHIEQTGEDLGDLKYVTIGGSAAPRAMIKWFMDRGIHVAHAWGMTETSPIGTCGARPPQWDSMSGEEQLDYVARQGIAPFGVELRTVDDDGNESAARRQVIRWAPGQGAVGGQALLQGGGGFGRCRPVVRHRRRRRAPPRWHHADHRPRQGCDQVRRRMDQLDRARKCGGRLRRGRGGGGGRDSAPEVGRAAAAAGRACRRKRGHRAGNTRPSAAMLLQLVAARRDRVRRRASAHRDRQAVEADPSAPQWPPSTAL